LQEIQNLLQGKRAMSLQVSPSGLFGLVMKIEQELREGKSYEDVLAEYPVSKTALPYLITLVRECSEVVLDLTKEYGELDQENISLKEQIKALESKNPSLSSKDTIELKNRLKKLENENKELLADIEELETELQNYTLFFESSGLCSMFYKNFLRKISQ